MLFHRKKRLIIVGCGRLGSHLAGKLSSKGYQIIIIDRYAESFQRLPSNFNGFQITADGTDIDTLKYADIDKAHMLIAVTDSDNENILIGQIASRIFNIEKVYIRLSDIENEKLIHGFNIEAIYPFRLSVKEFQRLIGIEEDEEEELQ